MDNQIIEALSWALVHSLWQGLIIGIVLWTLLNNINTKNPQLRFAVLNAGLIAMLSCFIYTSLIHISPSPNIEKGIVTGAASPFPELLLLKDQGTIDHVLSKGWTSGIEPFLGVLFILWISGMIVFTMKLFTSLVQLRKLRTTFVFGIENEFKEKIQSLLVNLGIHKPVEVFYSGLVSVPTVFGHFKPLVLLPVGFFSGLSPSQVEAILVHELAHIKRNDYLLNILKSVVEVIFFFHPVYWWISDRIQLERENCCDDVSVSVCSPIDYAKALTILEEKNLSNAGLSLAASGKESHLFYRIKRLVTPQKSKNNMSSKITFAVVVIGIFGLLAFNPIQNKDINAMGTPSGAVEVVMDRISDTIPPVKEVEPMPEVPAPPTAPEPPVAPKAPSASEPVIAPTPPNAPTPPEPVISPTPPTPPTPPANCSPSKKGRKKMRVAVSAPAPEFNFSFDAQPVLASMDLTSPNFEFDGFSFQNSFHHDTIPPEKFEEMERKIEERMKSLESRISETVERAMKDFKLDEDRIAQISEEWAIKLESSLEGLGEEISGMFSEEHFEELEELGEKLSEELEENLEGLEDFINEETKNIIEEIEDEVGLLENMYEKHFDEMRKDLENELMEDGLIDSKDDHIKIRTRDGEIYINDQKLSGQQAEKYKRILEKYIDVVDGKTTIRF